MRIISFDELSQSNLIVDAVYESSHDGQLGGEPLSKLLPGFGNMGGFRSSGRGADKNLVVLFSTGEDKDWPDTLDLNTGQFGVLVATSVVHKQAYQEVREDRHPIVFISGRDIAEILIKAGYNTKAAVDRYLETEFPV